MEKIYILCSNCTLLTTEIIGDGLLYDPNFIQFSKVSINLIKNSLLFLTCNYIKDNHDIKHKLQNYIPMIKMKR